MTPLSSLGIRWAWHLWTIISGHPIDAKVVILTAASDTGLIENALRRDKEAML
jgi:hypothetical protein